MMAIDTERLQSRAEFYLCLSHAFMTPSGEETWKAMRDYLADDLSALGAELGYGISGHVDGFRAAMAAFRDPDALLECYSGLFLVPPHRVSLNVGTYLDGAVNGGSVLEMEAAYRRAGLERSEDFRDLSDHVSVQLEFVASCYLRQAGGGTVDEAGNFLHVHVARWLPPFIADLRKEILQGGAIAANPYLHLACLLEKAVACDVVVPAETRAASQARLDAALSKARGDRAKGIVGEDDLAFIAQRLRDKGLSVDHLEIPPEQRDEARGWSRKVPPSPRRGSRLG